MYLERKQISPMNIPEKSNVHQNIFSMMIPLSGHKAKPAHLLTYSAMA
jgi:hypothetical protein